MPNLLLLQNTLDQTGGAGRRDAQAWQALVRDRLASLDVAAVAADVRPFLERPPDAAILTRQNLTGLLAVP